MATGESGIPFYNLSLQYEINKTAWAAYTLGHPTNISVAGAPFYYVLSLIQKAGIPSFIIQAVFFWVVLVSSGFSIYFLTKEIFPDVPKKFLILAVLFYWFNPISMVNVWNRFLNNFIIFYALLPLSLLLFLKGIRTRQYAYAILIGLVSVIFSYALTSIAFDILFWLVLIYTTFFYLFLGKEKNKLYIAKFFILTLIFWCMVNLWWIRQVFSYVGSGSFAIVASNSFIALDNYYTFNVLSEKLGNLIDLLRLKHSSFFADSDRINWVALYKFPLLAFFEFLISAIFLSAIVIKRKHPGALFLAGLFLLSIFFTKGNNPPFGEIFDKAFVTFSFLQVFRNPFEKIGFVLPLSTAPLFCLGAFLITNAMNRWGNVAYSLILFWLLIIWGSPFWTGFIFTGAEVPTNEPQIGYQVKVPEQYQEASVWLDSQGKNFRLAVLPIGGEGITYSWQKGYSGVELTNQLLPVTSVSFNTNIPFYNQVSKDLEKFFLTKKDFSKIMDILNSKYIIVRSDINWKIRSMRDPQTIQKKMEYLESVFSKFNNIKQMGGLSFWKYLDWTDKTVYVAKDLVKVNTSSKIEDVLQLDSSDILYYGEDDIKIQDLIKSEIIHPSYKFELGSQLTSTDFSFTEDLIFPAVRILPSNKFYPLILFKEKIETMLTRNRGSLLIRKISLLGKRLMEAEKELENNNMGGMRLALLAYTKNLQDVVPQLSDTGIRINDKFLSQEELYSVFKKHIEVINRFKTQFPENKTIETSAISLKEKLVKKGIVPYFGYIDKPNYPIKGRNVHQFFIDHRGDYELLLDVQSWDKYFKISFNEPFLLQVDNELIFKKPTFKKDYISFGFFNFDQGRHEISWNTPEEINLVEFPSELVLKVNHGTVDQSFEIHPFDPYFKYKLSFNYLIRKGSGLEVSVEQNNEKYKKDKIDPQFSKYAPPDPYNFTGIKQFSEYFIPFVGADSAKLVFKISAWNNCKEAHKYLGVEKCKDESVKVRFDLPTEISVTNVSLVKIITEAPFLVKENNQESAFLLPQISYTKVNGAEYKVKVEEAKNPFAIILSELFDPGWKVYESQDREIGEMHFLANTYANGWLINKTGTYELTIKFMPQEALQMGKIVSISAIIAGAVLLGWRSLLKHEKK